MWSSLSRMPKLASTKKLPDKKLIYSCVSGFVDEIPELVDYMKNNYSDEVVERFDIDELTEKVENYLHWISEKLSVSVVVLPDDVYSKLKELGL